MVSSSKLKGFKQIVEEWQSKGADAKSARNVTIEQVNEFEKIVSDDKSWNKLLEIFRKGRVEDAWLAGEWPDGFDELILCAPLCKFVDWECARCFVGKRQNNYSCANDDSLFGYIAVLLSVENRELLKNHLQNIRNLLVNENINWDMGRHEIYIKNPEPI